MRDIFSIAILNATVCFLSSETNKEVEMNFVIIVSKKATG